MLLYISIIGFAIALLLAFYNKNRFPGNYYLVGFFLINALYGVVFYSLFFSPSITFTAIMHGHFMPFLYLSGPFAYFYVRSLLTDCSRLKKSDLLHFTPFIILLIGIFPFYFKDFSYKTDLVRAMFSDPRMFMTQINFLVPRSVDIISRQATLVIYFGIALWMWIRNKEVVRKKTFLSGVLFKHIYSWVMIFLSSSLLVSIGMLILSVNSVYRFNANLSLDRMTNLTYVMGIFYFLVNCSLFTFPEILYGIPRYINPQPCDTAITESKLEKPSTTEAASRLQLSEDYVEKIERLVSVYTEKKPFLVPEFSLTTFSTETNIPLHHLSFYFNTILETSFSDWRNKLRIEFAVSLLKEGFARDHSLNAVSLESGFSSQATFIRAFKNHTGQTPGEYLKTLS